ncbi:hypothetical protein [Alcaligenes faecalis]|uniref:glycine-rich domain-containing protein n=1 Tax=Alcaligenes faecalis TaxID=511 RepID=UPI00208E63F5|nr:hypothetical protein [Alcaligenes faecalis]USP46966.1 hypothetical protein J5J84_13115 [Alcaligenes faecalis]
MATRIYKTPFAATGDKEVLATADQPDGKVSLQAGWTPDYELPNDNANYRPVGRAEMNGIFNELTVALGEMQLNGFAKWQSIDGGWPQNAHVLHNGVAYRSTADTNVSEPGAAGASWVEAASGRLLSVRVFSTVGTTTYTPTPGTTSIVVEAQGGGGAGGGAQSSTVGTSSVCPGGNAGSYGKSRIVSGFSGATVTVGAGGVGALGASGGNGGTSSFGALVSAPGGQGGLSYIATSPLLVNINATAQTAASGGNIFNAPGGRGQPGVAVAVAFGGTGDGGASVYGSGGRAIGLSNGTSNGTPGVAPGSGGSGSYSSGGHGTAAGGAGAPGIVIVWEYA